MYAPISRKKQKCKFNKKRIIARSHPSHKNKNVARVGHLKFHIPRVGEAGGGLIKNPIAIVLDINYSPAGAAWIVGINSAS